MQRGGGPCGSTPLRRSAHRVQPEEAEGLNATGAHNEEERQEAFPRRAMEGASRLAVGRGTCSGAGGTQNPGPAHTRAAVTRTPPEPRCAFPP